jgi:hypothetical protein
MEGCTIKPDILQLVLMANKSGRLVEKSLTPTSLECADDPDLRLNGQDLILRSLQARPMRKDFVSRSCAEKLLNVQRRRGACGRESLVLKGSPGPLSTAFARTRESAAVAGVLSEPSPGIFPIRSAVGDRATRQCNGVGW